MINISREVLVEELVLAQRVLKKWNDRLSAGVPGRDYAGPEEAAAEYVRELVAELLVVAGKLETIATVVGEGVQ